MQAAEPDCTLLEPEGFMRALAITTTICCAGERQILFLFVSGSEAREADFSTRGHTIVGAEEKKPCCWPELLSFFPNSTRVLVLGREVRGVSIAMHSEAERQKTRVLLPFSLLHGCQAPPGRYLLRLPA